MLLAYCITEAHFEPLPMKGVGGMALEHFTEGGLRCFVSHHEALSGDNVQRSALEFHHALSAILVSTALIPFRFPTLLAGLDELTAHIRENYEDYEAGLQRLRHALQMEARITLADTAPETETSTSGRTYLEGRRNRLQSLESISAALRHAVAPWLLDWKQKETSRGLRCYALVDRDSLAHFREAAAEITVEASVRLHLSGPWPASEFLRQE
jgi:hypothetical protein